MKHLLAVTILALTSVVPSPLFAQDVNNDGVVTYLVPVSAPNAVQGANGSVWKTDLWVHNPNDFPFRLRGCGTVIIDPPPCDLPFHPAGSTQQAYEHELFSTVPALMFDVLDGQSVMLTSRLFEMSKHAQPIGVELPVVREDAFFTHPAIFIAVPSARSARIALRLYNPRPRTAASLKIDFIAAGSVVASTFIDVPETLERDWPGYTALFDVVGAFPVLARNDRFDIRVSPVSPTREYWALVSVTDQAEQQMLLITADQQ